MEGWDIYMLNSSLVHNKWRQVILENFVIMITTKNIDNIMLSAWSYFLQQTTLLMSKKRELFS